MKRLIDILSGYLVIIVVVVVIITLLSALYAGITMAFETEYGIAALIIILLFLVLTRNKSIL